MQTVHPDFDSFLDQKVANITFYSQIAFAILYFFSLHFYINNNSFVFKGCSFCN